MLLLSEDIVKQEVEIGVYLSLGQIIAFNHQVFHT